MKTVEFYKTSIPTDNLGSSKKVWFVDLCIGNDSFDVSNGVDKDEQLSIAVGLASKNNCVIAYL